MKKKKIYKRDKDIVQGYKGSAEEFRREFNQTVSIVSESFSFFPIASLNGCLDLC